MDPKRGNYENLLPLFFGKSFVKVTLLPNTVWFDEIFFVFSTMCDPYSESTRNYVKSTLETQVLFC